MGDETWANIQMVKNKRESYREKMKKRKAERETILSAAAGRGNSPVTMSSPSHTSQTVVTASSASSSSDTEALSKSGSKLEYDNSQGNILLYIIKSNVILDCYLHITLSYIFFKISFFEKQFPKSINLKIQKIHSVRALRAGKFSFCLKL